MTLSLTQIPTGRPDQPSPACAAKNVDSRDSKHDPSRCHQQTGSHGMLRHQLEEWVGVRAGDGHMSITGIPLYVPCEAAGGIEIGDPD